MSFEVIAALLTLISLEIVLGIDNLVFISIISQRLPASQQKKARRWGLIAAMVMRLVLLSLVSLIMMLKDDLFVVFGMGVSGKDLILILGGLFLIYKATVEIHHKMEGEHGDKMKDLKALTFSKAIVQIMIMDMVFSIDSIITAVGMARDLWVMYTAVIVSVLIMLVAAEPVSKFINEHPSFKILALSFLLLIGFALLGEGFGLHIPKGYIYFSMAFSLLVDIMQMKTTEKKVKPVQTHEHYTDTDIKPMS